MHKLSTTFQTPLQAHLWFSRSGINSSFRCPVDALTRTRRSRFSRQSKAAASRRATPFRYQASILPVPSAQTHAVFWAGCGGGNAIAATIDAPRKPSSFRGESNTKKLW